MSLASFYLDSSPAVYRIEGLEISHSDFSQTFYVQGDVNDDLTLGRNVGGGDDATFIFVPLELKPLRSSNDLDAGFQVNLGDVGEFLAQEIDNVISGDGFSEKPQVIYRVWTSEDLTEPAISPQTFEIVDLNFSRQGASFTAKARQLNLNRTGERYTLERFPMLAGFL
jgi:hypothetical protein